MYRTSRVRQSNQGQSGEIAFSSKDFNIKEEISQSKTSPKQKSDAREQQGVTNQPNVTNRRLGSFQDLIFYPAIILCGIWSIFNLLSLSYYLNVVNSSNPECTAKTSPSRELIIVSTILFRVVAERPIENLAKAVYDKHIMPTGRFPLGSELRKQKADLLGERFFKILINFFNVVLLFRIMSQADCNFLDVRMGGSI
jgi:hypothetical protein